MPYEDIRRELAKSKFAPPGGNIHQARAYLNEMFGHYGVPDGTSIERVTVAGRPAEWVSGSGAHPKRVILYLHGGAYIRGSLDSHRGLAARLSQASGMRALVVDYRLAPEHPFPAAVDDALSSFRWLLRSGYRPGELVLAGDSAGGGLCLAVLLAARDSGEPLPAGAALMSPWTDLAGSGPSMQSRAEADPWLSLNRLGLVIDMYLAGADPTDPLASPLYGDLHGLPPLMIHVGNDEILLDDATRLAERARSADVAVALTIWEGMRHVFQAFPNECAEAETSINQLGEFVRSLTS